VYFVDYHTVEYSIMYHDLSRAVRFWSFLLATATNDADLERLARDPMFGRVYTLSLNSLAGSWDAIIHAALSRAYVCRPRWLRALR
jgi:hypothetical protein